MISRVVRVLVGSAMAALGAVLALSGMGYLGGTRAENGSASFLGSLVAGLGVALVITAVRRRP